ncbi:glycoside hydrolase family 2 TIM barrel-domain containing protein [Anaerocellum diazotrophicum]|uniref:Beta-galactosidase n=1 Tax=Caldicellulosiruptor diazotrophicus TaxID=2806205 RepID=A0ABN6E960_9FIRM|nr:glycoside hydrolase family 2 TIM barrel-domain containing protein [Caldicellulosiruptor diazotrophicus]BCS82085.1 beta-galactosidase [Caldicellulosiruptor diazotrophicus]
MRKYEDFDTGWKFTKCEKYEAEIFSIDYDDSEWRIVDLPHDWSIEGDFSKDHPTGGSGGYLPAGIGWYRKKFMISKELENKKFFIEFDGSAGITDVWINEFHVGTHYHYYTSFYFDITSFLKFGDENVIVVRVDNSEQPNSRWYTGSGLYRHVKLIVTERVHFEEWGVFIKATYVDEKKATLEIEMELCNETPEDFEGILKTVVYDLSGKVVAEESVAITLEKNKKGKKKIVTNVENPHLWSIENPYLYSIENIIQKGEEIIDCISIPFGIRTIKFDAEKGFLLNSKQVKIKGVCLHHDGGCVGAAVPEGVWERRLKLLKEMGCNAIRTAHNPAAPEFLDMCDRMGFLVIEEAFDEWKIGKIKEFGENFLEGDSRYGYHKYFDENFEADLRSMIRRDRNHPSIIIWSVGNEVPEQTTPDGHLILKKLIEICHEEDPTRPVTAACDQIEAEPKKATEEFLNLLDVVGYNYVDRWRNRTEIFYAEDHFKHPNWKIIGTEHASINQVRGEYSFEASQFGWWRGPYYTSMIRPEKLWKFTKVHDYVAGDFIWTGFDYLGESRWPAKNTSCGILDTCGFKKDSFYFYKSQWSEEPVLHIFPHWNWKGMEGKVIPVICYTNCDYVELFLNGKSLGRKCYEFPAQGMTKRFGHYEKPFVYATTGDLHLSWDVPYEPGILKAVGVKDGKEIVKEVKTTGEPQRVKLICDKQKMKADGKDVCHITVLIVDKEGQIVPDANNLVVFEVKGCGDLIGVDNGKPDSHESYKDAKRKAFNGMCLAIVKSRKQKGMIEIVATSEGLVGDSVEIEVD